MGEQPDEETRREKYLGAGSALSTGASGPLELGSVTLLVCGCVHPPVSSPKLVLLEF